MRTMTDAYDRVRLTLTRLNSEWSLTPDVLSPQAEYILRLDIEREDILRGTMNLIEAYACMSVAAARFLDPSDGPYDIHADGHLIAQWNGYFGAAGDMLFFDLVDSFSDRQIKMLHAHINKCFRDATALKQLMG